MPDPIAYASGKPDALAEGEHILHDYVRPRPRVWPDVLVALIVELLLLTVIVCSDLALPRRSPTFTVICVMGGALMLGVAVILISRVSNAMQRLSLRMTTHRLMTRRGSVPATAHVHDVHDLTVVSTARAAARIVLPAERNDDDDDADDEDASAESASLRCGASIELPARLVMTLRNELLCRAVRSRAESRHARREARRRWQPLPVSDIPIDAMRRDEDDDEAPEFALLAGEQLLWRGRPAFDWRVDLLNLLQRVLRAWLWIGVSVGGIAAFFWLDARRNAGLWWCLIVGGLFAIGQINAFVIGPIANRRRLGRTWYALTNLRTISFQRLARRRFSERSRLIDDGVSVSVERIDTRRGSVKLDFETAFHQIEDAPAVYLLVLRATRGLHDGSAVLPSVDEHPTPAVAAIPVDG